MSGTASSSGAGDAGSSSSDDEHQPAQRVFLSATQIVARVECSGELLKQSVNNPDMWRRRQCFVVADKLWCLKPQRAVPWARRRSTMISLANSHATELAEMVQASQSYFGIELQTTDRVWRFQATSQKEQKRWLALLKEHAQHASENELIRISDCIICDSESAQGRRVAAVAAQQQQQQQQQQ
jgi:hypothetical protein